MHDLANLPFPRYPTQQEDPMLVLASMNSEGLMFQYSVLNIGDDCTMLQLRRRRLTSRCSWGLADNGH